MTNCLVKSIVLYFVIIAMLLVIKPSCFYYDNNKTKFKPWNLYKDTNIPLDIINFFTIAFFISILCSAIGSNL